MMKLNKKVLWPFLMMTLLVSLTMVPMINVTSASPDTYFYVDPPEINTTTDFALTILVSDAPPTYAWEVRITWDPSLVELYIWVEGDFLKRGGAYSTLFLTSPLNYTDANLQGELMIGCTITEPNLPMEEWAIGTGPLFYLGFHVVGTGSTLFNLFDTMLLDHLESGAPAPTYYPNEDCFFYNVAPSHDITFKDHSAHLPYYSDHRRAHGEITDIGLNATIVDEGDVVAINVTVLNEGTEDETITLNVYADVTLIDTTVLFLSGTGSFEDRSDTHQVAWNTVTYGVYTISTEVPPVTDETDTADNTLTNGDVYVRIPGDADDDHDVDYDDLVVLAISYGSSSGEPAYDARADFDRDGDVDYDDLVPLAINYGVSI